MKYLSILFLLLTATAFAENTTLKAIFEEDWKFRLREDPLFATAAGTHDYDALLPSVKKEDFERRNTFRRSILQKLETLDRSSLTPSEQISYDLLKTDLQDDISDTNFKPI